MPRGYRLVTGPTTVTTVHMRRLLVRLAVHGRIRWLACGNYIDLQSLIYAVTLQAGARYYDVLTENIQIARAETCPQIVALLRKAGASSTPTFVSDLLVHFYDDKVRDEEAEELFGESVRVLRQLGRNGAVIISAAPGTRRTQFLAALYQDAGRITRVGGEANHGS